MDRYEKRRLELKAVIDGMGRGSISKAAKLCDIDATYLSRLLYPEGKAGKKRIGEDVKDKLINGLGNIFSDTPLKITAVDENNKVMGINVPLLNVSASMGHGLMQIDSEHVIDMISINEEWANRALRPFSSIKNLAFIHAIGDSMHPTFNDGDILMVDTGDKSVKEDKIYVLQAHERLFIKRVRQRIDGAFEISSDNPSVKTVDILNGEHDVEVKGRVLWVWNGRKL